MIEFLLCILCLSSVLKTSLSLDTCEVSSDVSGMCRRRSDCSTLRRGSTVKSCPERRDLICCPLWRKTSWPVQTTKRSRAQSKTTAIPSTENVCGQRSVTRRRTNRGVDLEEEEESFNLTTDAIVNGRTAVKGSWPWMAALLSIRTTSFGRSASFFCGGSIITSRVVLTAAHCLYPYMRNRRQISNNMKKMKVRVGAHTKSDGISHDISQMNYHKSYGRNYANDIGYVKLSKDIIFNAHVRPICLPTSTEFYSDTFYITGWGTTRSGGSASSTLREAKVKMVPLSTCKSSYSRINLKITDKQVCAGRGEADTCQGDSGGPMVMYSEIKKRWILVGITSFGNGCGNRRYPGVYTSVKAYRSWIDTVS
ncbi:venom protease-like [Centruroides sculpturatus]|uniref:venom protease-like n=1 Tax=Centruroides sculpturatus TaxID=218467 RepID=UPI000C6DAE1B|nr:venom protease-like [Centruroides sculpturatus]